MGQVYLLRCPKTGDVRYVGESWDAGRRYKTHLYRSHSAEIRNWVKELKQEKLRPILELVEGMSEEQAIHQYLSQGCNLANKVLITNRVAPSARSFPKTIPFAELVAIAGNSMKRHPRCFSLSREARRLLKEESTLYRLPQTKALEILLRERREARKKKRR